MIATSQHDRVWSKQEGKMLISLLFRNIFPGGGREKETEKERKSFRSELVAILPAQ
jgi:hypothetical protein